MSSETMTRARVLRGPHAAAVRGITMDDLAIARPDAPGLPAAPADELPEVTQAREQAARVGYEDGFEAGRREGLELAHAAGQASADALAQALVAVDAAAAALTERQQLSVADVEQQIATMALALAERIVGRELAIAHDPGTDAIARALRLAPARADVVARLHPDDVATLGDLTALVADRGVTVIPDAAVEPGGCLLDVGACRIDAQVGPALERVRKVLGA